MVAHHVTLEALEDFHEILDARSPAEFAIDHLPAAVNCPVLDNEERHRVGLLYKQDSFAARRLGSILVARHIADYIEWLWQDRPKSWRPLCYCWRGGQRSGSLVHVLRAVGWDARALKGGYKTWRRHVVFRLSQLPHKFRFRVLCGPTGSGKSRVLEAMERQGQQVLHLEKIARHRGSLLGAEEPQPSQRMFETQLMKSLENFDQAVPVYMEAESRRIGSLTLPEALWMQMGKAACVELDVGRAARRDFLLNDYVHLLAESAPIEAALQRWKSLHGARVGSWRNFIHEGRYGELVDALLQHHYDPFYRRSLSHNYAGYTKARRICPEGLMLNSSSIEHLAEALVEEALWI